MAVPISKTKSKNLMVKTRMFYDFRLTLIIYAVLNFINLGGWALSPYNPEEFDWRYFLYLGAMTLGVIIITLLVRDITDKLDDMTFNNPMILKRIFINEDSLNKFRNDLDKRKNSIIHVLLSLLVTIGYAFVYFDIHLPQISLHVAAFDIFGTVGWIFNFVWWHLLIFFLGILVLQILIVVFTFSQLGSNPKQFSIYTFLTLDINKLNDFQTDKIVPYLQFHRDSRTLGEFLFKFTIKTIFFIVLMDFVFLGVWESLTIVLVGGTFLSVLIFIIPQLAIHQILKDSKEKMIIFYENIYDNNKLELFKIYSIKEKENLENTISLINFAKEEIQYVKSFGTWAYDFPKVLRLVGAACLSFIPLILDYFPIL